MFQFKKNFNIQLPISIYKLATFENLPLQNKTYHTCKSAVSKIKLNCHICNSSQQFSIHSCILDNSLFEFEVLSTCMKMKESNSEKREPKGLEKEEQNGWGGTLGWVF